MPEMRDISVRVTQLRKGDYLIMWDSTVVDVSRKRVYTYVTDSNEAEHRFESDEEVTVSREFPTEEEAAQQRRDYATHYITTHAEVASQMVAEAKAKLIDNLDSNSASWHGGKWEDFAMAQAESLIWEKVLKVAEVQSVGLVEAAILVRDDLVEKLISNSPYRHSSTNMMTNTANAIESEVSRRWINELKWVLL